MTMPICFVDTEATGLHVDKQLWEVAIIRREFEVYDGPLKPYKMEETRYEAFVPVDLSNADLFGLNVGRFYDRHPLGRHLSGLEKARDVSWGNGEWLQTQSNVIANRIAQFTHGARFIGAAPSFDAEVLGDFLRKHGLLPTWHHRLVDTHDLLTGWLIGNDEIMKKDAQQVLELSKDEKVRLLGIEPHVDPKLVHTAMGDAQHEADIWDAIMG